MDWYRHIQFSKNQFKQILQLYNRKFKHSQKGVYFLREFQKEAKERATSESENASDQKQMSFTGFKFEQLMTASEPHKMPNTNATVDPNGEFNGVFSGMQFTTLLII